MLVFQETNRIVGYCTNVHAGHTYEQIRANLDRYTVAIKSKCAPDQPMGVGLWIPAKVAREMIETRKIEDLRDRLQPHDLIPFTLNGFPYGDFHSRIVKHDVYLPDWTDPRRLAYTQDLITILSGLLAGTNPTGIEGSISTLPIGWGHDFEARPGKIEAGTHHLLQVVDRLEQVEQETGRLIHLDLEPEPGCVLQTSGDVVELFTKHLDRLSDPERNRRYLRVCHDICHAAVMFEDQPEMLTRYQDAGVRIGKVQISSAIQIPEDRFTRPDAKEMIRQLSAFREDRYLHQTAVLTQASKAPHRVFYDDLPLALRAYHEGSVPPGPWRVHFHVPLFVEHIGLIETTQDHIIECLRLLRTHEEIKHFEVETYAWNVFPESLKHNDSDHDLADGIARELSWLTNLASS